ncbi:tetratricopeptide repeat protein, partial [Actinoplanes lutulentus]
GELVRTGLLTEHTVGRFTTHDLIRAYAQELVHQHEDGPAREHAFHRLAHHYRQTAYEADLLLVPAVVLDRPEELADTVTTHLSDAGEAIAWFNADRQVIKAIVGRQLDDGPADPAWRLAVSLQRFLHGEGWWHDWAAMARSCLQAATAAGDDLGRAYMSRSLAGAELMLGNHDSAARFLRLSLDLFNGLGNAEEQALVYRNLGQVSAAQENYRDAVDSYEHALRLVESLDDLLAQVALLYCLAEAHAYLGRTDTSMEMASRALRIAETLDDPTGLGLSYEALAISFYAEGDLPAALTAWKQATEMYRQLGWRMNWVESLLHQGDTALALGDPADARAAWQQALDLLSHLHVPLVPVIEERLTRLEPARAVRAYGAR